MPHVPYDSSKGGTMADHHAAPLRSVAEHPEAIIPVEKMVMIRIPVCVAFAAMLSGCGSSADPTSPTSPVPCSAAITIGVFSNGAPASPGQGMVWTSYFQATVLPAQSSVYIVDINSTPSGCLTA